jgi:hypothetical protein
MIQRRPPSALAAWTVLATLACAAAPSHSQTAPAFRPDARSTGGTGLEIVPSQPDQACKGKAGKTLIAAVTSDRGVVQASGTWTASPGTQGLGIEVRIDQDRQVLTYYDGTAGSWNAKFPFPFCGKHLMRVYAFAAIPGAARTELCFEGAPSSTFPFEVNCTPTVALSSCSASCKPVKGKGKTAADAAPCKLTCTGTAEGGMGTLAGLFTVNGGTIQAIDGPATGPWALSIPCKPGDKLAFWVRDRSGTGTSAQPVEALCNPK